MSGTCIGYVMIVSVRPCLGHSIDLRYETVNYAYFGIGWYLYRIAYVRVVIWLGKYPYIVHTDDVESNAPTPAEGTAPVESEPVTVGQGGGAKEAYLRMIDA
ncbi:Serine/threonine-protein kinase PrkC [Gossypium arboreum]|uniref:Serine/threonine-protein kinase PrkC n=1 Tax=Gossypium arboreum TaxID=29729 RepID=A0A0B0P7J7_GOSAR|nr:Serine/threonine-protein kinase PrkC [Gossypium arboreum]